MSQSLSVSMIIRDEPVDRLVMLIDFMRPLVSKFVIADTGSEAFEQDGPLLKAAGATVIQTPWTNDFAAARNSTLPYLESDWSLHLDADEWPSIGLLDFLKDDILTGESDARALGYLLFTRNFWGGEWGIEVEAHWHCRLFRTARGAWYKRLHEQVQLDGQEESNTRGNPILPKAPKDAYIIHSKPREKIEVSARLYREME